MKCKKKLKAPRATSGDKGCEAMNLDQFIILVKTLIYDAGAVRAGVLLLLQLYLGERADASRQCRFGWLLNLQGTEGGLPKVQIPPDVNQKTPERTVSLDKQFASLLHGWLFHSPLKGRGLAQWPFEGQPVGEPDMCLFPGVNIATQKRRWGSSISERAYFYTLRRAADVLASKLASGDSSVNAFTDFDLKSLGTHSVKKTVVSA